MASAAFQSASNELEARTELNTLEARGTLRIALKHAGLDAASVTPHQMRVVLERILPGELESRGIADPGAVCDALANAMAAIQPEASQDTPEAVFQRLGGGAS